MSQMEGEINKLDSKIDRLELKIKDIDLKISKWERFLIFRGDIFENKEREGNIEQKEDMQMEELSLEQHKYKFSIILFL